MQVPDFDFANVTLDKISEHKSFIINNLNETVAQVTGIVIPTFQNTIQPLINITAKMQPYESLIIYVINLYTSTELRDHATKTLTEIKQFKIDTLNKN